MIETTVAVQSGEVVALGGLISDREFKAVLEFPRFGESQWLVPSLAQKVRTSSRTELLVLLTPRVIRDSQEARDVTYEIGTRMRSIVPLGAKI